MGSRGFGVPRTKNLIDRQVRTAALAEASASTVTIQSHSIVVDIDVVAVVGGASPTLTITLQAQDPLTLRWYTLLASAALAATNNTHYTLHVTPLMAAAANVVAQRICPRTIRAYSAHGGAPTSIDYGVSVTEFAED